MRTCANPACRSSLERRRADARFCSDACRKEAVRLSAADGLGEPAIQSFWSGVARLRRPARGRQIKPYEGSLR